jgi:hypothetical protein
VNPSPSGRFPAGAGAPPYQIAFKLSDACKHGHDQLARMNCGVCPVQTATGKASASISYGFHRVHQVARRAGSAIEFPHDDCTTMAELIEHALKLSRLPAGA